MLSPLSLSWPLEYIVFTQLFGANPEYYSNNFGLPGHNGVDFAGAIGDPIHASADGSVIDLGFDPKGYGNYVVLAHKLSGDNVYSYKTLYGHMDEPSPLSFYSKVNTNDFIGRLGYTGNVFPAGPPGAHLHFGLRNLLRLDNIYKGWIDPIPFFKAQPTSSTSASSYVTVGDVVSLAYGISYLNMRSSPSITDSTIYSLMYSVHPPVKVDEIYNVDQSLWIRSGIYWMAFKHNGTLYMQVLNPMHSIP
jgi:murein DD-endopeptidase MepM/ murein hydrolase activator NlpD